MTCPGCAEPMTPVPLEARYGRSIEIDLCHGCNHVWFDGHEDLHLTPGGVIELFRAMGTAAARARTALSARKACPRCTTGLLRTHDMVRSTRYEFYKCTQGHGRLMSFAAFLRAKHFVRDLTDLEVQRLRADVRMIRCVGCGAGIDIATASVCPYCQAPIAILDADQLSKTLAELSAASATHKPVDPAWPLYAERVRQQTEAVFADLQRGRGVSAEHDLVETGLALFAKAVDGLLKR